MDKKIFAETPLYGSLTTYLRAVRMLKGLGLPTIAETTGFHTSNLSRIERTVHQPTADTLDRLASPEAYGCPWWNPGDNRIFLRALAYHLHPSPAYAPRNAEWWPADMVSAVAAVRVVAQGTMWSHSVQWPALVENWPALGLPGWFPTTAMVHEAPPPISRPLWLWGSWGVTLSLEHDTAKEATWVQNIANSDDTDLATVVLGYVLTMIERTRHEALKGKEVLALPIDAEFRAVTMAWPGLSAGHRRLVREFVEALSGGPA